MSLKEFESEKARKSFVVRDVPIKFFVLFVLFDVRLKRSVLLCLFLMIFTRATLC